MKHLWKCAILLSAIRANEAQVSVEDYLGLQEELESSLAKTVFQNHIRSARVGVLERIHNPVNLAVLPNGDVLVASFMTDAVVIQPRRGGEKPYILLDKGPFCRNGQCSTLDGPWGLALDGFQSDQQEMKGNLLVSSFGSDQLLSFSLRYSKNEQRWNVDTLLDTFGSSDDLDCPEGVAFDRAGEKIYVASFLNDEVAVFNRSNHKPLGNMKIPSGTNKGKPMVSSKLNGPEDLCFGPQDELIVSSYYSNRVLRIPIESMQDFSVGVTVNGPVGVLCLEDGFLIASYKDNNIQKFSYSGDPLGVIASGGGLSGPSGLSLSLDGTLLYVASYDNNRIVTFNISSQAAFDIVAGLSLFA